MDSVAYAVGERIKKQEETTRFVSYPFVSKRYLTSTKQYKNVVKH